MSFEKPSHQSSEQKQKDSSLVIKEQDLNKDIYLQLSNSTVSPKTIKSKNRQNDEGSSDSNLSQSEKNKELARQYSNGEVLEENDSRNIA